MARGEKTRFEAPFRAPVLQTQGRRARARGCRAVGSVLGCREMAEQRRCGEMLALKLPPWSVGNRKGGTGVKADGERNEGFLLRAREEGGERLRSGRNHP